MRGGEGERFVGKPQKNSTIHEPEPEQIFAFAANVFLLRFQFKMCAKVARNVAEYRREGGRRRRKKSECTVSAECMQTNSAMNTHARTPLIDSTDNGHIRLSLPRQGVVGGGAGSELCSKLLAVLSVFT